MSEEEIKMVLGKIQKNPGNIYEILVGFLKKVLETLPIMVTKQAFNDKSIKDVMETILTNSNLHSLTILAPYISEYILGILAKSNIKKLVLIINKDEDNPDYVNKTLEGLKKVKYHVIIMQRPPKSSYVHMKVMIPYLKVLVPFDNGERIEYKEVLVPSCVICGSVNYTKSGIEKSDEMLIVMNNKEAITVAEKTLNVLLSDSEVKYESQMKETR